MVYTVGRTSVVRGSFGKWKTSEGCEPVGPVIGRDTGCGFAQRIAMVSNAVGINEEVDPTLIIKRLKAGHGSGPLTRTPAGVKAPPPSLHTAV